MSSLTSENETCPICLTEDKSVTLTCKFECCTECFDSQVEVQLSDSITKQPVFNCPNFECRHVLSEEELQENVSTNLREAIDQTRLKGYLSTCDDIVMCPRNGCSYSGFVTDMHCSDQLDCQLCSYKWKLQSATKEKVASLKDALCNLSSKTCPKCNVIIEKSGGCRHISCQNCGHEFCWLCSHPYHRYQHDQAICHGKLALDKIMKVVCVFLIILKVIFMGDFSLQAGLVIYHCVQFVLLNMLALLVPVCGYLLYDYIASVKREWRIIKIKNQSHGHLKQIGIRSALYCLFLLICYFFSYTNLVLQYSLYWTAFSIGGVSVYYLSKHLGRCL